jgi:hypothetical protein
LDQSLICFVAMEAVQLRHCHVLDATRE